MSLTNTELYIWKTIAVLDELYWMCCEIILWLWLQKADFADFRRSE